MECGNCWHPIIEFNGEYLHADIERKNEKLVRIDAKQVCFDTEKRAYFCNCSNPVLGKRKIL